MSEPLSAETIARMKAEHVPDRRDPTICGAQSCFTPYEHSTGYPCDAALLLAELERVQAPAVLERWQDENQLTGYDQGIHAGLLGPVTSEELP